MRLRASRSIRGEGAAILTGIGIAADIEGAMAFTRRDLAGA